MKIIYKNKNMALPHYPGGNIINKEILLEPIYYNLFEFEAKDKDNNLFDILTEQIISYEVKDNTLEVTFCINEGLVIEILDSCIKTKNINIKVHNKKGVDLYLNEFEVIYRSFSGITVGSKKSTDIMELTVMYSINSLYLTEDTLYPVEKIRLK